MLGFEILAHVADPSYRTGEEKDEEEEMREEEMGRRHHGQEVGSTLVWKHSQKS